MSDDQALRDAIRDRIADLGDEGVIVVGYAAVVEVVSPGHDGPWLKTLQDCDSTPWAQVGRVAALHGIAQDDLAAGWSADDE